MSFTLEDPKDDGLIIPTVSDWSYDKYHFLARYIHAFTNAMKGKWDSLHYIDLFAGTGIVRLETSQKLIWGSPLIAAQSPYPFAKIHVCEKDKDKLEALKQRLLNKSPSSQVVQGDANEKVHEIIKEIPSDSLSLAFLDPYGLHLDFETLRILSQNRMDLIIFFPDKLDILRNWAEYYLRNPDSNLDRYLGKGPDWRSVLSNSPPERYAERVLELYIDQIRSIGYMYFEQRRISMTKGQPLYQLIFCSKHSKGVDIWRKVSRILPNGQRELPFEE